MPRRERLIPTDDPLVWRIEYENRAPSPSNLMPPIPSSNTGVTYNVHTGQHISYSFSGAQRHISREIRNSFSVSPSIVVDAIFDIIEEKPTIQVVRKEVYIEGPENIPDL